MASTWDPTNGDVRRSRKDATVFSSPSLMPRASLPSLFMIMRRFRFTASFRATRAASDSLTTGAAFGSFATPGPANVQKNHTLIKTIEKYLDITRFLPYP